VKALRFERTGDLAHLELVEAPTPAAGQDEVLVEVKAAGVNRSDLSNVMGNHRYTTLPRVPGRDFAGVLAHSGEPVWGTGAEFGFTRDGSHAAYLVIPSAAVARKPRALSFIQAAACGVPYVTAWHALEQARVGKGTKLLVLGAAGAVGSAAVHLARLRAADVQGAVRADLKAGEPLQGTWDVIFDTTGHWLAPAIAALERHGRVVVIVAPGEGKEHVPIRELYRREASIVGVNSLLYSPAECARLLRELAPHFESGALRASERISPSPLGIEPYAALKAGRGGKFVFSFE
jgi:NADPH:quinone reductase-like Zn-dependent oxidoreductase